MYVLGELMENNVKYSAIIGLVLVVISFFLWDQVTTIVSNIIFSIAVYNLCHDKNLVIVIIASSLLFSLVNYIADRDSSPFDFEEETYVQCAEAVVRVIMYLFVWGYWGLAMINRILFPGGVLDHPLSIYGFWLIMTFFIPCITCKVYDLYLRLADVNTHIDFTSFPRLLSYVFILSRLFPLLYVIVSVIKQLNSDGGIFGYISSHWDDVFFSIPFIVFCIYSVCAVINCIARLHLCRTTDDFREARINNKIREMEERERDICWKKPSSNMIDAQ